LRHLKRKKKKKKKKKEKKITLRNLILHGVNPLIPIEKRLTNNHHSLFEIKGYLNLSNQSPKIRTITHKDFGDEKETF
jgi:hypothetical protein